MPKMASTTMQSVARASVQHRRRGRVDHLDAELAQDLEVDQRVAPVFPGRGGGKNPHIRSGLPQMPGGHETVTTVVALAREYHKTVMLAKMFQQMFGDGHAGALHEDDAGDAGSLDGRGVGAAHLGCRIDRQTEKCPGIVVAGLFPLSHEPPLYCRSGLQAGASPPPQLLILCRNGL